MSGGRLLTGIGVSPGVAYAVAAVVRWDFPEVPDRGITAGEVKAEIQRLRDTVLQVSRELEELRQRVLQRAGEEESRIFDAQIMMAQDEEFLVAVEHLIRTNLLSAETAYEFKALELRNLWGNTTNVRLRDRLVDLTAVQVRMLARLMGQGGDSLLLGNAAERVIAVAHELAPGLTVQLDRESVVGLVSEEGTRTSHAAILAHSLGIPAVMGVPGALDRIRDGQMLLLDGHSGTVLVDPTPPEMEQARIRLSRRQRLELSMDTEVRGPVVTPDGQRIRVMGNVDLPEEIEPAQRHGAEGVGLLRTEFLLTGRTALPTETEQRDYFRRVADAFHPATVVVRTFDLGGDKFPAAFQSSPEANPFLGWRAIRVCLDHPEVLRTQIRAVLRAAVGRDVQLMLPLITSVDEVEVAREIMAEEAEALRAEGVRAVDAVPLGVMVETPAAVLIADRLATVSEFFSVGTNDLTQYTLAVDRGNARLATRFMPHHPAVLRQLRRVAEVAREAGIPASICGEMASDPLSAVLLMGLGFEVLSVSPHDLPRVKWVVRRMPLEAARRAADAALAASNASGVLAAMREVALEHIDERAFEAAGVLPPGMKELV